jgi:hypothetical protein
LLVVKADRIQHAAFRILLDRECDSAIGGSDLCGMGGHRKNQRSEK